MLAVDTPEMRVGLMRGLRCGISKDSLTPRLEVVFVMEAPTLANFPMSIFLPAILKKRGSIINEHDR